MLNDNKDGNQDRLKEKGKDVDPTSNAFLTEIIESLQHPFYVIDAGDYKVILANSASGIRVGETCHHQTHHHDKPCDQYGHVCPLKIVVQTREPVVVEHKHFDSNNHEYHVEIHAHPILDDNGNVKQIIEYCLDISTRKRIERLLLDSEERYRTLVDMLPNGIEEVDTTGTITLSNRAHHQILGYKNGELVGKKIWDLAPTAEERQKNREYFQYLVKHQPPQDVFLGTNLTKDGRTVEIKVAWDYKYDENGKLTGFVGVVTDITEQSKTIRELENMAGILHQSTDSIALTNLEGEIEYVNPMFEKVTGYTLAEVKGKKTNILKSNDAPYPPDYYQTLWNTIKDGNIWRGEFMNKRKNGETFIEEAAIFPFRDARSGKITGYGTVKKDITLRRDLEGKLKQSYEEVLTLKEKAEEANQLKSQFLANMSHDIRTPLNAVLGFTDLLLQSERRNEPKQYLDRIRTSSQGLLNLINDILDLSKIEAGQLDIHQQTFCVKDLVKDIASIFEIQFTAKDVVFDVRITPSVPDAACNDKWRLNQVLTNLLSNALKFTDSGRVNFHTGYRHDMDLLVFTVKDTGPGITAQNLGKIFDPFKQVATTKDTSQKGTGLGLAICKKLVELMGGTITVTSTPGVGTEFTAQIPAFSLKVNGNAGPDVLEEIPEVNLNDKKGNKILIVDDNPVNMELLLEQFKNAGFSNLISADNGETAVQKALSEAPDLILMDIQMPEMDGNQALSILKQKGFKQPIIMLSAFAMRKEIENSLKLGAVGYITKPIDFQTFFSRIAVFLNKKKTVAPSPAPEETDRRQKNEAFFRMNSSISPRLRGIFLEDVAIKGETITQILAKNVLGDESRSTLRTIAHGYLGNAGYFGLTHLRDQVKTLEQSINNAAPDADILAQTRALLETLQNIAAENKVD